METKIYHQQRHFLDFLQELETFCKQSPQQSLWIFKTMINITKTVIGTLSIDSCDKRQEIVHTEPIASYSWTLFKNFIRTKWISIIFIWENSIQIIESYLENENPPFLVWFVYFIWRLNAYYQIILSHCAKKYGFIVYQNVFAASWRVGREAVNLND